MTGEVPDLDAAELRALQLSRLRDTLTRAYEHVPHYRRAFELLSGGRADNDH